MCSINLSNMGKRALEVHANTKKHRMCETNSVHSSAATMSSWLGRSSTSASSSVANVLSPPAAVAAESSLSQQRGAVDVTGQCSIAKHVDLNVNVTKAEILYTMHIISRHQSYNSTKGSHDLLSTMFPDSEIAQKFSCNPNKCSYLTSFGLAPYFDTQLHAKLKEVQFYSVSFDESFNHVTKNEQMDFSVRFWDTEKQLIVNRYLGSQFLGHATARDIDASFKKGIARLENKKLTQISMDGPNVNHKFYKDFCSDRALLEPELPLLFDIGTCGLHVVHGAFRTGFESTGWKLDVILKSLWYLFNESPARMDDYKRITGCNVFPLQFCGTRWLDDRKVAERALSCWENITKYTLEVSKYPKSKIPKCSSYISVVAAVNDKLTIAKLHVFVLVANILHPFLEQFQNDKPMIPFLGEGVHKLINCVMENFIKRHLISETSLSSVLKTDVTDAKNYLPLTKVEIGFAAQTALNKAAVSAESVDTFKQECLQCYKSLVLKLQERSPLQFEIVRLLCCLNPKYISTHSASPSIAKFAGIMNAMIAKKFLGPKQCDQIANQYKAFVREKVTKELFCDYNVKTSKRLDAVIAELIGQDTEFRELFDFFKMILTLSHGQASVERGFSTNKDVIVVNMLERTVVAQRVICDGINNLLNSTDTTGLDVSKIEITTEMLQSCKGARMKYETYLDQQRIDIKKRDATAIFLSEAISSFIV